MRTDQNSLRMYLKTALDNLWARITTRVDGIASNLAGVTTRVGNAEGRLDDVEDSIGDLDGDMIKSISLNGTNVPKDAQGKVALQESDPTVPPWAKQAKAKTSDFTNDGSDGTHPFISADDVVVPTKTSDLTNDGDGTSPFITRVDLVDQAIVSEDNIELTPYNISYEFNHRPHKDGEAIFTYISPAGMVAMLPPNSPYSGYSGCTFRGASYTKKQYMTFDDFEFVGWMDGTGIHELVSGYIHHDASVDPSTIYITNITPYSGGGGGVSGAVDTVTFNGALHTPDANGNVSLTETDPTVPAWAKAASKPTYTASEVGAAGSDAVLATSTSFPIPASGSSVSYSMAGLTAEHQLVCWNFSVSAENTPPADLTCTPYAGYFTVTNTGGTTSESMQPVFALPRAVAITSR